MTGAERRFISGAPGDIIGEGLPPGVRGTCHLPFNIRDIYDETMHALIGDPKIVGEIGLRTLIEAVCKEKDAAGKNSYQKIDDLRGNGDLTPDAEVHQHIRGLGNTGVREARPSTGTQLGLAKDAMERLLMSVYILPERIKVESGKTHLKKMAGPHFPNPVGRVLSIP